MREWRSIAGPAMAATAITVGLVAAGCGDSADKNVVPPPLKSGLSSVVSATASEPVAPAVSVPPSPTWQVASETQPPASEPSDDQSTTTRTTRRTTTTTAPSDTTTRVRPTTTRRVPTTDGDG